MELPPIDRASPARGFGAAVKRLFGESSGWAYNAGAANRARSRGDRSSRDAASELDITRAD